MVRSSWPVANWFHNRIFQNMFYYVLDNSADKCWNLQNVPSSPLQIYILRLCLLDSTPSNSSSLSLCNRLILRTLTIEFDPSLFHKSYSLLEIRISSSKGQLQQQLSKPKSPHPVEAHRRTIISLHRQHLDDNLNHLPPGRPDTNLNHLPPGRPD